jgi:hypothetical protein
MSLLVEREDVWAASIEDKPGALAAKLTALAEAGADLDFIITRHAPEKPGTGVVFVTPLRGDAEIEAAAVIGFSVTSHMHSVRVEGENQKGIAATLTTKLGAAGINLRGFSGAVIGKRFVLHVAMEKEEDVKKAMRLLAKG